MSFYKAKTKKQKAESVSARWIENEACYNASTFSGLALEFAGGPSELLIKMYLRSVLPARYPHLKEFEKLLSRTAALIVDYSARVEQA